METGNGETEHLGVVKLTEPAPLNSLHFYSSTDSQIMLTLTQDGRLVLGPGISKELATQVIAEMLVKEYHKLTGKGSPELLGYIENKQLKFLQNEGSFREATLTRHERLDSTPVYIIKP